MESPQELTQEVEEIVKEFRRLFSTNDGMVLDLACEPHETIEVTTWLQDKLTSLAERAEERGEKKAAEHFRFHWWDVAKKEGAEEILKKAIACVKKQRARVHQVDSEAFGYELLEDFKKNSCCPGDDATYGFEKACEEILTTLTHLN